MTARAFPWRLLAAALAAALATALGHHDYANDAAAAALSDLVPDVLRLQPLAELGVRYGDTQLRAGQELTPTQVQAPPSLQWAWREEELYTVCMTDPDAPSRAHPTAREFLHWLVVNVPGGAVHQGEALAEYVGAGPPKGTGLHRYALLTPHSITCSLNTRRLFFKQTVFAQDGRLSTAGEPRRNATSRAARPRFSIQSFADRLALRQPALAASLFQAQWDSYVPLLHAQLS